MATRDQSVGSALPPAFLLPPMGGDLGCCGDDPSDDPL